MVYDINGDNEDIAQRGAVVNASTVNNDAGGEVVGVMGTKGSHLIQRQLDQEADLSHHPIVFPLTGNVRWKVAVDYYHRQTLYTEYLHFQTTSNRTAQLEVSTVRRCVA